jgi:hypothetical protein
MISCKLPPMADEAEERTSGPVEDAMFECQTPDDEDIRENTSTPATDRKNNLERAVTDLHQ